ncbi:MAG: hypothetical protein WCT05_08240 [Lentisphaeria bacterium]
MAWVEWDYWINEYQGEEMEPEEFSRLEAAARRYVDRQTFGRIDPENISDSIKNAVCAVIEAMQVNANGGGISSESIGEYSVTYVSGISKSKTDGQRMRDALVMHLGDTGLLYRGGTSC